MTIREASIQDIDVITLLFNDYRVFYKQEPDLEGAQRFLKKRLEQKDSIIYLAWDNDKALGFTQLYPIFSSVSMEPMYILNDLYILPSYRGQGIGTALINTVKKLCKKEHQKGIVIQTETTNPAQKLYEHLGFKKDPDLHYFWANKQ